MKVFSAYLTDRIHKKKLIAFLGYSTSLVYKSALISTNSWVLILGACVIDCVGKGIRTTPIDVMVAESVQVDRTGTAFGVHKAMAIEGFALGILMAFFLVRYNHRCTNYFFIFLLSMIPAGLSLVMFFFIKEHKHYPIKKRDPF